jgi:hypothetical protein
VPAGQLEQIRTTLLEKLPQSPELAAQHIWPWWPWWPWWDCTPDIIFRVTQNCNFPGAVILDEGYANTRWDIADPLDVTLIANDLACCRPTPPCIEGDCIDISSICSDEYLSIDAIAGNRGAVSATPAGYAPGDRPFSETIAVLKANTFVGVDYYEIEEWDPVGLSWGPRPAGAAEDFCRHWLEPVPIGPWPNGDVPFKWHVMSDGTNDHVVVESREHWEATVGLPPDAFWTISEQLVVPLDSTKFADGTYTFHVVGWQEASGGKVKNRHVLPVCGIEEPNEWVLTFDNRITNDPAALPCSPLEPGLVHLCTLEPTTELTSITIGGTVIPACGTTDLVGNLEIDFTAADPDGHLLEYELTVHWGAGNIQSLIGLPGATLTRNTGDGQGPTYAAALGQGFGAASPNWHGGTMTLTVPAAEAFPEPGCDLIQLQAWERPHLGHAHGSSGIHRDQDVYTNISEFTVGVGVCDPPKVNERVRSRRPRSGWRPADGLLRTGTRRASCDDKRHPRDARRLAGGAVRRRSLRRRQTRARPRHDERSDVRVHRRREDGGRQRRRGRAGPNGPLRQRLKDVAAGRRERSDVAGHRPTHADARAADVLDPGRNPPLPVTPPSAVRAAWRQGRACCRAAGITTAFDGLTGAD